MEQERGREAADLFGRILLLDPEYGLVNTWLARLPFVGSGPFNIYSFWGIVWVHVLTGSVPSH